MTTLSLRCIVNLAGPVTAATGVFATPPTPDPVIQLALTGAGGEFSDLAFFATETAKNQILAVALAAISTQSNVLAYIDPPGTVPGPLECYGLQIVVS